MYSIRFQVATDANMSPLEVLFVSFSNGSLKEIDVGLLSPTKWSSSSTELLMYLIRLCSLSLPYYYYFCTRLTEIIHIRNNCEHSSCEKTSTCYPGNWLRPTVTLLATVLTCRKKIWFKKFSNKNSKTLKVFFIPWQRGCRFDNLISY